MKILCMFCAAFLIIACFQMPIGYYTLLRILITLGALVILVNEVKKDVNLLGMAFIIILILFNPLVPIYLYQKIIWMPLDIIIAALFLIYGFKEKTKIASKP
ncbi:DUF6804 family protein [Flavobacterium sp.]|uniref:DUF6804 family protein n=1 Tax=Flavobacterium sp. TaxID=239 RepID=UPI0037500347